MKNWLQKIAYEWHPSYLDIGHNLNTFTLPEQIIVWLHDGQQIKFENSIDGHEEFGKTELNNMSACGRIEVDNNIGSCVFQKGGPKERIKIIEDIVAQFPNVKFTVYSGIDHRSVGSLQEYFEEISYL